MEGLFSYIFMYKARKKNIIFFLLLFLPFHPIFIIFIIIIIVIVIIFCLNL